MKNPYKVLDVPKDANEKEIKKAYYDKAKKEHPDVGGDEEQFKETSRAYELLICPQKRAYFDENGCDMPNQNSVLVGAYSILDSMVEELLNSHTSEQLVKVDIISMMKMALQENLNKSIELIQEQKNAEKLIEKYKLVFAKKLKIKKSKFEANLFEKNLINKEKIIRDNLLNFNNKKEIIEKALKIIDDYDFEFEPEIAPNYGADTEQIIRSYMTYFNTTA